MKLRGVATYIKDVDEVEWGELYHLDPPLTNDEATFEYVVVNAEAYCVWVDPGIVELLQLSDYTSRMHCVGTYVFPAWEDGKILTWGFLHAEKDTCSPFLCLYAMGYKQVSPKIEATFSYDDEDARIYARSQKQRWQEMLHD